MTLEKAASSMLCIMAPHGTGHRSLFPCVDMRLPIFHAMWILPVSRVDYVHTMLPTLCLDMRSNAFKHTGGADQSLSPSRCTSTAHMPEIIGQLNLSRLTRCVGLLCLKQEDISRKKTDEMKKRAIHTAGSYDEFRHMVSCAQLTPVT